MSEHEGCVWIKTDLVQERIHAMEALEPRGMAWTLFARFCESGFQPFPFDAVEIAKAISTEGAPATAEDVLFYETDLKRLFKELPGKMWIADPEIYSQIEPDPEDDDEQPEEGAPLSPPDLDLRGMEWMPFYGDRLFTSDTWLHAGPEARTAALKLWWESWKQCPAGSLPNTDIALAQLAGYGMMVAAWRAIKDETLHGWVLCNDGRIYHPVVCDLAMEAAGFKDAYEARQAGGKRRKRRERDDREKLFEVLRARGIVPAFNTPTAELRRMASEAGLSS